MATTPDNQNEIDLVATRIMYIVKHPNIGEYTKLETLKKLINMIEPTKVSILSFAVSMTPLPEDVNKQQ